MPPLPHGRIHAVSSKAASTPNRFTSFVFTEEARRNLLLSVGVPKWIVDGTKPPRKPRHPHG